MSRLNCPCCGSTFIKKKFYKNEFQINKCLNCKTLFVENLPNSINLKHIYESESYYGCLNTASVDRIKRENKRRLNFIKKIKISGSILDIGTAKGLLLDCAKEIGYDTFGIEISEANAKLCESKGHKVFCGTLDEFIDNNIFPKKFDIICCLDVIEHTENPQKFIYSIIGLMNSHSLLVLSTPNYSGLFSFVLGKNDPFMTPPEHLNFFSKKGLSILLAKYGLKNDKYINFGVLTNKEVETRMKKIPFIKTSPAFIEFLTIFLNSFFILLNKLRIGLEMEFYISQNKK